jgi:hypothetical protein
MGGPYTDSFAKGFGNYCSFREVYLEEFEPVMIYSRTCSVTLGTNQYDIKLLKKFAVSS